MRPDKKNLVYTAQQAESALSMMNMGFSIRQASKIEHVPESTLRAARDRGSISRHPGKPSVLTKEEEDRIVQWIFDSAKVGLPVDTQRLRTSVAYYIGTTRKSNNPFGERGPGRKWVKLFLGRHPNIARRVPSALSKQRTFATEERIRGWFREVDQFIHQEELEEVLQHPQRIFNMDETSIRMIPTKEKVLAKTGQKYVHTANANAEKECYTVLFSANACGTLAPPLVLFPYKQRLPGEIASSAPDGWAIGKNVSGWMNQETFYYYLKNVFHPWLIKSKIALPILLFVDGHKSHVSFQTTEFCRAKKIVLICLYPNSTHVLQPLDVAFFRGLKVQWNKHLIQWRTFHAGEPIKRHEFTPLLKQAVDNIPNMTTTLKNGFRKCGLSPWNPDAVNYSMLLNIETQPDVLPNITSSDIEAAPFSVATTVLDGLEAHLTLRQLKSFEQYEKKTKWPGQVQDTNLFYVWQRVKQDVVTEKLLKVNTTKSSKHNDFQGFEESDVEADRKLFLEKYHSRTTSEQEPSLQADGDHDIGHSSVMQIEPSSAEHIDAHHVENSEGQIDSRWKSSQAEEENLQRAASVMVGVSNAQPEHGIDDFFDKAFRIPFGTARPKSVAPNPKKYQRQPAVATSEAFKIYFERLEREKHALEQEKLRKKAIREQKRMEAKQKTKPETKKHKEQRKNLKRKDDGANTKLTEVKHKQTKFN